MTQGELDANARELIDACNRTAAQLREASERAEARALARRTIRISADVREATARTMDSRPARIRTYVVTLYAGPTVTVPNATDADDALAQAQDAMGTTATGIVRNLDGTLAATTAKPDSPAENCWRADAVKLGTEAANALHNL